MNAPQLDGWDNIPGFNREQEEYVNLDLDKWLKDHKIREEGRRLGSANQPPADAKELDSNEEKIRAWINRRGAICRENVSRHLADLERQLSDMENPQELESLRQQVEEIKGSAELAIERESNEGRNKLLQSENDVRECTQDFSRFRKAAGLTRVADYSQRKGAIWFIVACFLIESALNATLLMDVNVLGLLGSIAQMGLISAVNILIFALAMGFLLRQANHVSNVRKRLVWTGIVLVILVDFSFNLLVGHFRESMREMLNDASADFSALGADAVQRLLANPFAGIESFHGILLALLGFLCFSLASWKWHQRDDPYPEYGRRDRQLRKLQKAYREEYNKVQGDLRRAFEDYESKLKDMRHQLEIKQSKWREICRRGSTLVENYPQNLKQYQRDLDYLLRVYRDVNQEARTKPVPQHFSEPICLEKEIFNPPSFAPPAQNNISNTTDAVHEVIMQTQDIFRTASRQLPALKEIDAL